MKRFSIYFILVLLTGFAAMLSVSFIDDESALRKKAAEDYQKCIVETKFTAVEELHWTGRTLGCKPGKVPGVVYTKLLKRINYFRRIAGVHDDIVLDSTWNKYAQAAALIMFANNTLNHDPGTSMKCYSEDGRTGASSSNLSLYVEKGIEYLINDEMQDGGVSNRSCGHRRWLLNSKACRMGIGITDASYAVRVFAPYEERKTDSATYHGKTPEYFGYPFQGYIPYQVVYPKWSFSIPGTADFSKATVEVVAGDKPITCVIVNRSSENYGDPTMVWEIRGMKEDYDYDYFDMPTKKKGFNVLGLLEKKVTVKIKNVKVGTELKSYTYSFTIFDPES